MYLGTGYNCGSQIQKIINFKMIIVMVEIITEIFLGFSVTA